MHREGCEDVIRYGVVIPARNEEELIGYTMYSLRRQTIGPSIIVVVDDSSSDNTVKKARKEGALVVHIERRSNAPATGTPYLAYIYNRGFEVLKGLELDYVMISGAECLYPPRYVEELTSRMARDRVVVASGAAIGEPISLTSPRGAGRLVEAKWFRSVGFRYPLNYGFETWLLFKAISQGRGVRLYRDVTFFLLRRTGMSQRKALLQGKGMKALGYSSLYVLLRMLHLTLRGHQAEAIQMVRGYIGSGTRTYVDVTSSARRFEALSLLRGGLRSEAL